VLGVAVVATGVLPWLIASGALLPRLTETFAAGGVMALALLVVVPRSDRSHASLLLRLGILCFYLPVAFGQRGSGDQLIQAAKYVVFPALVLAVTEATNRRALTTLRTVALWSGTAAITVNLALGLAGVATGTRDAGEILGFATEHDLALLAGCLTAASIAATSSLKSAPSVAAGAIVTVATGVRSTLPGLGFLVIGRMLSAGARARTIVLVGAAVAAIFVSGAADVLEARFHNSQSHGEFQSFSALGSGRGAIYTTAFDSWLASSPIHWLIGTGPRSIPRFEEAKLGSGLVGHSDLVEVGVQLGLIGLVGFLLIWGVLIVRAESKAPLLVLASFSIFNGALEYSAPLVIALLLTAGARAAHDGRTRLAWPLMDRRSEDLVGRGRRL
jgi:hypothetical protein